MNHKCLQQYLQNVGADWLTWVRNLPSHMGGVWERYISSAISILYALMKTHGESLDDELLRTIFAEVKAIVNSISNSQNLLTMKSKVIMTLAGPFSVVVICIWTLLKWTQHIADEFQSRWRNESLHMLQEQKTWRCARRTSRKKTWFSWKLPLKGRNDQCEKLSWYSATSTE